MILYSSNCRVDIRIAREFLQSCSPLFFGATATDHGVATKKSDFDRQSHEHRWPGFTTNLEDFYGWAIHSSVLTTSPTKPLFKSSNGFWKAKRIPFRGQRNACNAAVFGGFPSAATHLGDDHPGRTPVVSDQTQKPWARQASMGMREDRTADVASPMVADKCGRNLKIPALLRIGPKNLNTKKW